MRNGFFIFAAKTSEQVAPKLTTENIAEQENTSKDTIKRYIRLTKLIKPLLDLVDKGKIAFTPAEKISYIKEEEQRALAEMIQDYEATPSLSQLQPIRVVVLKLFFSQLSRGSPLKNCIAIIKEKARSKHIQHVCADRSAHLLVIIF